MMKSILATSLVSFFFIPGTFAKEFKCGDEKKLPKVVVGCEGEACGFHQYDRALKDIVLYEKPDLKSKKLATVKRCEELRELEVIMIVRAYGKAKVIQASDSLSKLKVAAGDIVPLQQYRGEGYLSLCVDNTKDIDAVMDEVGNDNQDMATVKISEPTKIEPWMRLKSKTGIQGYAPRSDETVMWYGAVDESLLCDPSHKKLLKNF